MKSLKKIKIIDLFAGAGGFSAGFERAGFDITSALEHIAIFSQTHSQNFKNSITLHADITKLNPEEFSFKTGIEKTDATIIIGGPPCQSFSTIGTPKIKSLNNGKDKEDPRNYLFKYFLDYVEYFRPLLFVVENVPALRTKYKGRLFDRMLNIIDDLGYCCQHEVLNAVEYGVPQTRKRLFIVGTRSGIKFHFPKPKFSEAGNELNLYRTVYDAIYDLPKIYDGCRENTLPYSKSTSLTEYQNILRNKCGLVSNNICRVSNDRAKKVFPHIRQGGKYMDLPPEIRKILPFREDIFHDRLKKLDITKPSWTVLAHIGMDGYMYIHPTENRTLSVREAARIQGFHDSFVFCGNMREQYVQVGNAVPPLLAEEIGKQVYEAVK